MTVGELAVIPVLNWRLNCSREPRRDAGGRPSAEIRDDQRPCAVDVATERLRGNSSDYRLRAGSSRCSPIAAVFPLVPVVVESKMFRVALSSKIVPDGPRGAGCPVVKPKTPMALPLGSPWPVLAVPAALFWFSTRVIWLAVGSDQVEVQILDGSPGRSGATVTVRLLMPLVVGNADRGR